MCGGFFGVLVLSLLGSVVMRVVARALGLRAQIVFGLGRRVGKKDRPPGLVEVRAFPIWFATHLADGATNTAALLARASAPLAILLVPLALAVSLAMARGAEETPEGPPFVVGRVVEGSPADEAGIEVGDVIVAIGDRPVTNIASVIDALAESTRESVVVVIQRGGARRDLTVVPERSRIGIQQATVSRSVGPIEATVGTLRVVAGTWSHLLSPTHEGVTGPVGIVRQATARGGGGVMIALVFALGYATLAPLVALLSALGQLRMWFVARRSLTPGPPPSP